MIARTARPEGKLEQLKQAAQDTTRLEATSEDPRKAFLRAAFRKQIFGDMVLSPDEQKAGQVIDAEIEKHFQTKLSAP